MTEATAATEQPDDLPDLNTETLFGDLRDAILQRLRAMPKPWTVMSEKDQREMIDGVQRVAEHLVNGAVHLVAANGRPSVVATCDKFTVKEGMKVEFHAFNSEENVSAINSVVGRRVLIVLADSEPFMGEQAPAAPDPDQPDLVDPDTGEVVKQFRGRR